jgi:hypothetical protein
MRHSLLKIMLLSVTIGVAATTAARADCAAYGGVPLTRPYVPVATGNQTSGTNRFLSAMTEVASVIVSPGPSISLMQACSKPPCQGTNTLVTSQTADRPPPALTMR